MSNNRQTDNLSNNTTCSVKTTCPYCGVGCGVDANIKNQKMIAVSGDTKHPANYGKLCVKGSALHETMGDHERLLYPSINGQQVDWPTAIAATADKLNSIRLEHGPDAIAFYLSGQLLTEDYYVANKLAKGFIGTANVDTNSRLCMSSAVAGYKRAFGSDAVPCNYQDLEQCDLLIITGSNAAWTHPVLYQRMVAAKRNNPSMKIVVIDPRRTATCDLADLHLPLAPGSDAFIFNGLLNYLANTDGLNKTYIAEHTEGFQQALTPVDGHSIDWVAEKTGLSTADLKQFYQWYKTTEKTITFYSMGVNQSSSGTDKCNAIINCHLATGSIGKAGAGPFSITGQPNAMGGREVGGLANMLAAHMDYSPQHIKTVGDFWQAENMAQHAGLKAVDLFDELALGNIKAIWIMGTNPAVSMPNANKVKAALEHCDTVIVSDCVAQTDTTATANILLPAMGWAEKSGTVTNSERRISRQRGLLNAAGEARADWWIMSQVAQQMGFLNGFNYQSPRDVFVEHAALSAYENSYGQTTTHKQQSSRLFNIGLLSELSELEYDQLRPMQWPITTDAPSGTRRLFTDNQFNTASGKAQFVPLTAQLPQQRLSKKFPLALNTGRIRDQWHTMTRTARSPRLLEHTDCPTLTINPSTAKQYNLQQGDLVNLATRSGSVQVIAELSHAMAPQHTFMPMHWSDQYASNARVDSLIAPIIDPISGQPEFKYTPAQINKIYVMTWASIVTHQPINCDEFLYWHKSDLKQGTGYVYQVASIKPFNWQKFISAHATTNNIKPLAFEQFSNSNEQDERFICYTESAVELAIYSHSSRERLPKISWLQALFEKSLMASSYWALLTGEDYKQCNSGKMICSCFKISQERIVDAIESGAHSSSELGTELKCGTNCGSCIPELNTLVKAHQQQPDAIESAFHLA